MKVSPYLVHEAMQVAPVDPDWKAQFRQASAAIQDTIAQLSVRFTFVPRGCGKRHDKPSLYGFCSADHAILCVNCEGDQPS